MIKTNYKDLEQLVEMINQHRKWMLESANIYGMGSEKTLKISQELDELILVYQKANTDQSKTNGVGEKKLPVSSA
ncbi:aspartyl-phosphate phosphatase Spo0E family protein [Lentibacillus cibarius]|uniref:Aspartyl-phosphate phosphatase Spo0E family protein n=1 Tax=Lentibacillus cibarius TaxID=2583219 RepID=A0A549YFP8_9BACI|nr:aspartyl-phosphate phosphatase Spo0E family protein [Lentibacillus cibarius]TRM10667.1 aspartyl-phosphate phosphatase Spo0E family protein [Lentibacillus cibarius]